MTKKNILYIVSCFLLCSANESCEEFIDVNTPDYKLDSKVVFSTDNSAQRVLDGIYNQLFNTSYSGGGAQSVTYLAGLSADNFDLTTITPELTEFNTNQITTTNAYNLSLWSGAYNIIYQTNALLNGIPNAGNLSQSTQDRLEGSGRFIRGFTYFYLVNLYGDVPLILDTGYQQNALATRTDKKSVYNQILKDLESASELLNNSYTDNDRTRPNRFAALAMLARVHLFLGHWEQADAFSSQVIAESSQYELMGDLNSVFLANSREAIWQISPIGSGSSLTHTREGNIFIKTPTTSTPVELSESFLNDFRGQQDKRTEYWIDVLSTDRDSLYYPNKYKIQYDASGGDIREYSMVLRLTEQYFIRSEAAARMNNLENAVLNINIIRSRASIPVVNTVSGQNEMLNLILLERRRELFAEWGQRWFDLRRFEQSAILRNKLNSNWEITSNLFPIPASELMNNPNLTQNPGY
ncbi:MAG TPA: RagB/SusD family nutrient uptake outer membrane protein [Leeuwenhoekiella sp.]|nr:RagB/SusD family nutrient uptake outer membrane protein [Leeuwenhoekiella sp.]